MRGALLGLVAAGLAWSAPVAAVDFKSVAAPSILYDGPSEKARPVYIISRGTPVEWVVSVERWAKVREQGGELLWIDRRTLSDKRTVIVSAATATVRKEPADTAGVVFEAAKDVLLERVEPGPPGWVKVRHTDGQSGFAHVSQVWGH